MKLLLKISGIAILLIVVGVLVFILTLDINQYKPTLMAKVSEQTGREFSIEGDLQISPSLAPSISVSGISLGNAPWASDQNMLSVGLVEARVSLIPLMSGTIHINHFILHDTTISLEKAPDGSGNWELQGAETSEQADSQSETTALPPIIIEEIEILNAQFIYRDQQSDSTTEFSIREFSAAVTDLDEPFNFGLEADMNEIPIALSGTLGPINTLLSGELYTFDIRGDISELEITLEGSIANALEARGGDIVFSAATGSLLELGELTGSELPDLGPVTVSGNIKFDDPASIDIESLNVVLGQSTITGSINFESEGDIPGLTAQLQSDLIDLSPFASETEEEVEFLFPRDELPLEALTSINVDLSLQTNRLVLPSIELTDNRLSIQLQDGNLRVSNESGLAGGNLSTTIGLQTDSDNQTTLSTNISGNGILLELLPHEDDKWFVGGSTDIAINGQGTGTSIAEIMGSYNGNLLIQIGEATLPNSSIDMFGADVLLSTFNKLNPLSKKETTTLLECAVINLPVNDGIINVDSQIAIQTSKMYMVGSGEINLKDESINLGVKPYAKKGIGLNFSSVAGAAKIGGTLANPGVELDGANALKLGVSAGAAVATGGLSLLAQGLFSKTSADPDPCNTALGIASSSTSASPAESSEQAAKPNTAEKVIDDVKNKLRGLF